METKLSAITGHKGDKRLKAYLIFWFSTSNKSNSNVHEYNDRDGIFKERFVVNNIISVCQIDPGIIVQIFM